MTCMLNADRMTDMISRRLPITVFIAILLGALGLQVLSSRGYRALGREEEQGGEWEKDSVIG